MPTGSLPESGRKLWEKVYEDEKKGSCKGDEECAAKRAWGAVRNAGWKKDENGNWHKKADLQEFSLTIKNLSIDRETQERRWKADTSDTVNDSRGDNMTIDLFKAFTNRIAMSELAPEEYRSEFWKGGMPYLSISHYSDLDGKGVPGEPTSVYVDGRFLKAKGKFYSTPLGDAAWKALMDDREKDREDKVRISIGFLDYGHIHKSNSFAFKRESLDDFCPECLRESLNKEYSGKSFTDGMLVHFAMTRVPVNKRTDISPDDEMEVKSEMVTQKDDAASIVGEENAEELEKLKSQISKKSTALVEFADVEKAEKKCPDCGSTLNSDGSCPKCDKEDEMEEEGCGKKKKKSEVVDLSEVLSAIDEIKSLVSKEPEVKEPELDEIQKSELYPVFKSFVSAYEDVLKSDAVEDEKLRAIQQPFNSLGEAIIASIKKPIDKQEQEVTPQNDLVKALSDIMTPIAQKLDLLLQVQSEGSEIPSRVPPRRSLNPAVVVPQLLKSEAENQPRPDGTVKISDFAKKSVGLQ